MISSTDFRRFQLLVMIAVVGLAAGCGSSPTSPAVNVPFSPTDLVVGTGADAVSGKQLTVNYTGWLYAASQPQQKGAQFDTSIGKTPFVFVLGAGRVIAGWDRGFIGMKVGGQRRLVIPPELGYGSAGSGPIPPNATLVFDVELLGVQ